MDSITVEEHTDLRDGCHDMNGMKELCEFDPTKRSCSQQVL